VAFCDPLVPLTVKLNGFVVDAVRLLRVSVPVCPANIDVGLNVQVGPEEHDRVMFPEKLEGAEAETVKVAVVLPIEVVTLGAVEEREKTATPVPATDTVCGLPVALSLMLKVAVRAPLAVGAKRILTVQLCPTLST
jgi:hypothetical protein